MKRYLIFIVIVIFINICLYAKPLRRPRTRRNAYRDESRLWPKAIVPYTIDEAYDYFDSMVIEYAMEEIQSVSCIRFKRQSDEEAYVEIVKDEGCKTVVGYKGRRQKLTLGEGCISVSFVLHELFHVLGFFHEHNRPDRDNYVTVNEDNIKPKSLHNFRKKSSSKVTTLDLPYDYDSLLHYHDREFAINRSQTTLERIIGEPGIGKAVEMSKMDILKLNKLYRCPKNKMYMYLEDDEGSGQTELENNYIIV